MEQRKEHRFKPNQTAIVRVLGWGAGPVLQTSILDVSGSGMRLRTSLPVPCGIPIEIEGEHMIARGSVCRCEPAQELYELGVQVSSIDSK